MADLFTFCDGELTPFRAARAVEALGWLAPWWLRKEVIEKAREYRPAYAAHLRRPELPRQPGGCWVLLVRAERLTWLQDALLLPLLWRPGYDDARIPGPLLKLARDVRTQAGSEFAGWGLSLPGEGDVDLSSLGDADFKASSAWASLAGGLLLARNGLTPDPKVWASAEYDPAYGIGEVGGLKEKFALAADWDVESMLSRTLTSPSSSRRTSKKAASNSSRSESFDNSACVRYSAFMVPSRRDRMPTAPLTELLILPAPQPNGP